MKNQPHSILRIKIFLSTLLFVCSFSMNAQDYSPVQKKVIDQQAYFQRAEVVQPMSMTNIPLNQRSAIDKAVDVDKAIFLSLNFEKVSEVITQNFDKIAIAIPFKDNSILELHLIKAKIFSDEFKVYAGSDRSRPLTYTPGVHYWGMVKDYPNSLVAISFYNDNIAGIINFDGRSYDLGKLENSNNGQHILYENKDLKKQFELDCSVIEPEGYSNKGINSKTTSSTAVNSGNCVKMYLETDYSMYQYYGSVADVTNYVSGAFSQVILLYANESINMVVNELVVWDVVDPYTGTNTSDALNQFRTGLNGNYNGDLAHLIGRSTEFSGGIAYINVICNSTYGVGVSGINSSYNNVPTYSWTVMVMAHEIGHNLGSRHTHDCVWNGNNTPIDGCGPQAGYSGVGCDGATIYPPLPTEGGTVMSYCHLTSVGINLSLGFGTQPGDLIRSRVDNASCLSACGPLSVSITASSNESCAGSNDGSATASATGGSGSYSYSWSNGDTGASISNLSAGTYIVTVNDGSNTANDSVTIADEGIPTTTYYADTDGDGFGDPSNTIEACFTPNGYTSDNSDCNDADAQIYPGGSCNDGDNCTSNDVYDANCNCFGTATGDDDDDGVCDAIDVCPGGDDNVDTDNDKIPDFCDCNDANTNFPSNTLSHSGGNSSSISISLPNGSKDPSFSISEINQRTNGKPANRFIELVTVTYYIEGNNNLQTYGSFSGAGSSTAISISGFVESITVSLEDNYDGNSSTTMNISLSNVTYCADWSDSGCPDADGDGVCDVDDVCPGFDDNLIGTACDDGDDCTINDVYGSNCNCEGTFVCEVETCTDIVMNPFDSNPLTHSGVGNSSTTLVFPLGNTDVSFTISNINKKTNGKPSTRYIERVVVTYIDGANNSQTYGAYEGTGSANVDISGVVQSVTLTLDDAYTGSNGSISISIDMSDVTSCMDLSANPPALVSFNDKTLQRIKLYPNPAKNKVFIKLDNSVSELKITFYNVIGKKLKTFNFYDDQFIELDVSHFSSGNIYFVIFEIPGQTPKIHKLLLMD